MFSPKITISTDRIMFKLENLPNILPRKQPLTNCIEADSYLNYIYLNLDLMIKGHASSIYHCHSAH